jgi:hypothetical protein
MIWGTLLSFAKTGFGWVLNFLNTKVEADARVEIARTGAISTVAGEGLKAISHADDLNAKRPWFEPIMLMAAVILFFFTVHTAFVCLDSIPWHMTLGAWFMPTWKPHIVGSWNVPALPGMFAQTEHAVLQSLFVGAAAAGATLAIVKGLGK